MFIQQFWYHIYIYVIGFGRLPVGTPWVAVYAIYDPTQVSSRAGRKRSRLRAIVWCCFLARGDQSDLAFFDQRNDLIWPTKLWEWEFQTATAGHVIFCYQWLITCPVGIWQFMAFRGRLNASHMGRWPCSQLRSAFGSPFWTQHSGKSGFWMNVHWNWHVQPSDQVTKFFSNHIPMISPWYPHDIWSHWILSSGCHRSSSNGRCCLSSSM